MSGWGLGGACKGVQLINVVQSDMYICVQVCALNTDLMPATPTREFLSGFDRGGMSLRTNIYAHKQTHQGLQQCPIGAVTLRPPVLF